MKIFQIVNGMCHWQTPFQSLDDTIGKFPPDCIFVEAPDYVNEQWGFDETEIGDDRFIKPTAPEGFYYDDETGQLMSDEMAATALEEAMKHKQSENNDLLANYLSTHPLTWTNGKQYGITLGDQQEIALNLQSYQLAIQAADAAAASAGTNPDYSGIVLEWHAIHEACVPWDPADLTALSLAIRAAVYPWYNKNQAYKEQIYACTKVAEVLAIVLDYSDPVEETPAEEPAAEETV